MRRNHQLLACLVSSILALGGCQKLLGFEDFSAGSGGSAAGGTSGASGSGATADAGSAAGPTSAGAPGEGTSGVACSEASECADGLTCLYGFCRASCADDTQCAQDSVCLFHGDAGGCRLASETCSKGHCQNGDLVCGLDATCRIACGDDNSCDAPTQRCIAGSCVSTVGEHTTDWDCGGVDDGSVTCKDGALSVCNVTAPGLDTIEDCGSAALCEQSLPPSAAYDPEAPPACAAGCKAAAPYCSGSTLLVCKDDGSGPVGAGDACATKELCAASAKAGEKKCRAPVCAVNEAHCAGGQTELRIERCSAGRDKLDVLDYCEQSKAQCNPAAAACAALSIDPTEVSEADYHAWLTTTPSLAGQPAACAENTSFAPDSSCESAAGAPKCTTCKRPMVCVDWCDAQAYCAAHGRHLCGKIGGGMNPFDRYADPGSSQWMNGCSAGGQFDWAGGAAPQSAATDCSYQGTQLGTSYDVGTHAGCKSPSPGYATLSDLSGNVEEWEDSCEKTATAGGKDDACRTRGGSFDSARDGTRCDAVPAAAHRRLDQAPTLGFRCCG